jgi:hypothetical protein
MSRRATGVSLIAISVLIYIARMLAAAISGSGLNTLSDNVFQTLLDNVGQEPVIFSIIALIAGLVYLLLAEVDDYRKRFDKA